MFRRLSFVLALLSTRCSVSLGLDDGTLVACESDADCPAAIPVCAVSGVCIDRSLVAGEGPKILAVNATSATTVEVVLDLELLPTSVTSEGFVVDGLALRSVALRSDRLSVLIETAPQIPAVSYTLRAPGLRDLAGRPLEQASVGFRGFGVSPDDAPPDLVAPADGSTVVGLTVLLAWSGRAAASAYTLEVARDPSFAQMALAPIVVAAPATTLAVPLPTDGTYYWRVRSDIQLADTVPQSRALHVLTDTVYVACPDGAACVGGAGTRDQPFQTAAAGIALASRLGLVNVAIAGRAAPYSEALLVETPMTLSCGWDTAFVTRDPDTHGVEVVAVDARGPLYVAAVDGLVVRGCHFTTGSGRAGVQVVSSSAVRFENVRVVGPRDALTAVIRAVESDVALVDSHASTVASSTLSASDQYTVDVVGGAFTLERSTLDYATAVFANTFIANDARVEIVESDVFGGSALTPGGAGLGNAVSLVGGSLRLVGSRLYGGVGFSNYFVLSVTDTPFVIDRSLVVGAMSSSEQELAMYVANLAVDGLVTSSVLAVGGHSASAALRYTTNSGHLRVEHSSLFAGPPGAGTQNARAVSIDMAGSSTPSCAPYSFALVNNILSSNASSAGNVLAATQLANTATLLAHNVIVSPATSNALAHDGVARTAADFGCANDSQGNVLVTRDPGAFFTSFAGVDGVVTTFEDNVYAPTALADRALARAGAPSTVTDDFTGAVRTTSPPSCGALDLP